MKTVLHLAIEFDAQNPKNLYEDLHLVADEIIKLYKNMGMNANCMGIVFSQKRSIDYDFDLIETESVSNANLTHHKSP